MTNRSRSDVWKLLDLVEDFVTAGFRRQHPEPPDFPRYASRTAAAREIPAAPVPAVSGTGTVSADIGPAADDPAGPLPAASDGDGAILSRERRETLLAEVAREVSACTLCRLCEQRRNAVPGMGVMDPLVMILGEGPGEEEDRSGIPFVGRAGQYLDKWLDAVGLSRRTNCWIGNIVKCRPPGNRDPKPDEEEACLPYLKRQISLLRPRAILTVGRISSRILTGRSAGIGALRGGTYSYTGIPVVPTYHPSAVLRNPDLRKPVWDDLRRLRGILDA